MLLILSVLLLALGRFCLGFSLSFCLILRLFQRKLWIFGALFLARFAAAFGLFSGFLCRRGFHLGGRLCSGCCLRSGLCGILRLRGLFLGASTTFGGSFRSSGLRFRSLLGLRLRFLLFLCCGRTFAARSQLNFFAGLIGLLIQNGIDQIGCIEGLGFTNIVPLCECQQVFTTFGFKFVFCDHNVWSRMDRRWGGSSFK